MTDLTEYTWYYCKMKDGDIQMLERGSDYFLSGDVPLLNNEVEQVLAEVPSYELWKAVYEQWKVLLDDNKHLKHDVGNLGYKIKNQRKEIERQIAQNAQLKELLKECKDEIDYLRKHYKGNIDHFKNNTRLDKEINQALGEDK